MADSDSRSDRIYLSPPHVGEAEREYVQDAFDTNWLAPVGPHIDAFEEEFAGAVGASHAVALSSGTAALHLALRLAGVGEGDTVLVSTFTFCASVNPILYQGARPVFIDCERASWNMDPELLETELRWRAERGKLPAAVVVVHVYGQPANLEAIAACCARYEVPLVEDAAESLGATCGGRATGTFGLAGVFSFNGNKVITTSAGGMLVTDDEEMAARARKLATQAREPVPYYEHREVGYNYRMSNVLAGIGRGQLEKLPERVAARRGVFEKYRRMLGHVPGLSFMPEAPWGRHSRWLTCLTVDRDVFGADPGEICEHLEAHNVEARRLWKPMHQQPVYESHEQVRGSVADDLFARGICLPSGSNLSDSDLERVASLVADCRR